MQLSKKMTLHWGAKGGLRVVYTATVTKKNLHIENDHIQSDLCYHVSYSLSQICDGGNIFATY